MSKISARDIQVFVAGVVAYLGLETLNAAGNVIVLYPQSFRAVAHFIVGYCIIGAVGLLLGLSIAAGNKRALRWAQVFLWLLLVVNAGVIGFRIFKMLGVGEASYIRLNDGILGFLCSLALLSLIAWSRSMRFRYADPDTADALLNVRRSGFMSRISPREIQVFVAGVISYIGFHFLAIAAYSRDTPTQASSAVGYLVVGGVSMVLGISIVAGNMRALRWLKILLWLVLLVKSAGMIPNPRIPTKSPESLYNHISGILMCSALLWLIAWSGSKRFQYLRLAQRPPDHEGDCTPV